MKKVLLLCSLSSVQLIAQVLGPYSTTANFVFDSSGTSVVAGTWGNSASIAIPIQFNPPRGYQTRIVRVYGDFIAWPKSGVMAGGTSSEVGWGLKTTAPDGSSRVSYPTAPGVSPYDNSFVWIQNVVTDKNTSPRATFDFVVKDGGLLEKDNIMVCQPFVALNTSGLTLHLEPTFTIVFQFELIK